MGINIDPVAVSSISHSNDNVSCDVNNDDDDEGGAWFAGRWRGETRRCSYKNQQPSVCQNDPPGSLRYDQECWTHHHHYPPSVQ